MLEYMLEIGVYRMNKNKISKYISIFPLILMFIFIFFILKIDILPTKILTLVLIVIISLTLFGILLVNLKRKIFKILGTIFLIISILINIIGSYYLYFANEFLDKTFKDKMEIVTTYYVVTSAQNNYTKKDIKGNIYYYKDVYGIKRALKKMKNEFKINEISSDDLSLLFKDVEENKTKLMLIDKDTYNLVFSLDNKLNKDKFEIIYKFNIKSITNVKEKNRYSFNVYVGGKDFTKSFVDFNMIASFNVKTKKIILTSIPRDYYIEVFNKDGRRDTLSYMGPYGIETRMKSLEKLFDLKIDYYVDLKTQGLVDFIDSIEGINYCSDQSFTTSHAKVLDTYDDSKGEKLHIVKGCQKLNGVETLTLARERKALYGGDRDRQKNCQKIVIAALEKLKEKENISRYRYILSSGSNAYETTIPRKMIMNIAKEIITSGNTWKIETQSVDGTGGIDKVHLTNYKSDVMYPDMVSVNVAKNKIKEVTE